jgi:hypothetical protein
VSKFEKGERRLDVIELIALCGVLKVDPASIVSRLAAVLTDTEMPL